MVLRTTLSVTFADTGILFQSCISYCYYIFWCTFLPSFSFIQLFGRFLFFSKTTGRLFEVDSKFYNQISRTTMGTKFVPSYACIFMDYVETEFFEANYIWPRFGKTFIGDIFLCRQKVKRAYKNSLRVSINSTQILGTNHSKQLCLDNF